MPTALFGKIGKDSERFLLATRDFFEQLGEFFNFCGSVFAWIFLTFFQWRSWKLLIPQMYEVGVRSVPVVALTGGFIGMVMALETFEQFRSLGQQDRIGSVITITVVKQIGPVLAAVMLAGRVGGALTAELGTMNVTEQLDALRVMGTDPIRYLVAPRFLACLLLTPVLTIYSDLLGILGGWLVSTRYLGVPEWPYWEFTQKGVETWQIMVGVVKAFFFGGAIGLISCYKGFTCGSGASGVGRACTEAFVMSFIAIITLNFFFAKLLNDIYFGLYGPSSSLF